MDEEFHPHDRDKYPEIWKLPTDRMRDYAQVEGGFISVDAKRYDDRIGRDRVWDEAHLTKYIKDGAKERGIDIRRDKLRKLISHASEFYMLKRGKLGPEGQEQENEKQERTRKLRELRELLAYYPKKSHKLLELVTDAFKSIGEEYCPPSFEQSEPSLEKKDFLDKVRSVFHIPDIDIDISTSGLSIRKK